MTTRILVVDDSEITRAILARTLRGAGFEVLEARDGAEGAVKALRERPAVVVTDLEMPTMDGFPLLRLLKADPLSSHIPVLILTSHGEAASRFWSLRTGADAYLTKDYRPQQLVTTVARLVAVSEAASEARISRALEGNGTDTNTLGPLEVLARVARQLDASLLQATLINSLLERGMAASDFHEASRVALEVLGQVVDARCLAVAVAEPEAVTVEILLLEPIRQRDVDALRDLVVGSLDAPPGHPIHIQMEGPVGDGPSLDLDQAVSLQLAVREAQGILILVPRDRERFSRAASGLVHALAGHLTLVLDNARLSHRLHEMSTRDGLTRQLNHRAIYEQLTFEMERARRYRYPLSVILCDMDHFKEVNDTYGHLAGDAVLREGAEVLRASLRAGDLLGRYGGEEFLAVLPQVEIEAARAAAERLRIGLEGLPAPLPTDPKVRITASFGVASMDELGAGATSDLLVSLADRRLYEAKAAGRNCVRP
ncbi:MAG TPA: diguanylate cyclase [Thermoanaerobaculia bacterium]|jgi:two-component system cell cycle response regulator|nr:diguanylate cyclase [Thermoanaerobaculia bacterium]